MLMFRSSASVPKPVSLPAYFQETVFLAASDAKPQSSFFRKVWGADYKRAEETARLFMVHGRKLAAKMNNPNFSLEDGIVALIDMQRKKLGAPINKSVHYKDGDVNRLWPGLHVAH